MPTYKHRDYVLVALESVFAQTFKDYEVIVINDGSPDDTSVVLRPLVESGKIRYIEQSNAGQSVARNRGIAEARGEFIALLDDDDLWPSDKLENQVEALQRNPAVALVYGKVRIIDGHGNLIEQFDGHGKVNPKVASIPLSCLQGGPSGNVYEQFNNDNYIVSPGLCLIRRSSLMELGEHPFDPEIQGGADDWDLYLSLSRKYPFIFQEQDALYYRVHDSNASRDTSKMLASIVLVRQKLYKAEADAEGKQRQRKLLSDTCVMYVDSILNGGNRLPVTQKLKVLCKMAPYVPRALFWRIRERIGTVKRYKIL